MRNFSCGVQALLVGLFLFGAVGSLQAISKREACRLECEALTAELCQRSNIEQAYRVCGETRLARRCRKAILQVCVSELRFMEQLATCPAEEAEIRSFRRLSAAWVCW
jgi:hypothetical protein